MKQLILGFTLGISLVFIGCIGIELDNSQRLMRRPDFKAAVQSAPEWVEEALLTINRLESLIERGLKEYEKRTGK